MRRQAAGLRDSDPPVSLAAQPTPTRAGSAAASTATARPANSSHHGDVVVIEGDARVRSRRRAATHGPSTITINSGSCLIDYVPPKGGKPNGTVDATYTFRSVQATGHSMHGGRPVVIEDYVNTEHTPGPGGVGIVFPFGLVQPCRAISPDSTCCHRRLRS
jgi:hypothetical protein